jgi:prepilin-type N-terminal cleavage/methylation domain-containing protein
MTRRSAFSLIELLVVMTVGTAVMAATVSTLYLMIRLEAGTRQAVVCQTAEARLAGQFRRDVHAAVGVSPGDAGSSDGPLVRMELPGGRWIEYRRQAEGLARTEQGGPSPAAHDIFPLVNVKTSLEVSTDTPAIVVLEVHPVVESGSRQHPSRLRIEARLGADYRFETDTKK